MTTPVTTIGPDGQREPNPRTHLYRVLRDRDRLVLDTTDGQVVVEVVRDGPRAWRMHVVAPPGVAVTHERENEDKTP